MDPDHFHFNEWAFMARTDPEAFERCREQCIRRWLAGTGRHRPHLEALQTKIDAERERAQSPQLAVLAISRMMHASLCDLAVGLKDLSEELKTAEFPAARQAPAAPSWEPPRRAAVPAS